MSDRHTGSCLCGAVSFTVAGALRRVVFCHCTQCRKQSGHFVAATNVADDDLAIDGEENVAWYVASDSARRGFCRTCGSTMFWKANGSARMSIMAGTFDKPSGLSGERHIFTADKGDYYEIADGLPQDDGVDATRMQRQ